RHRIQSQIHSLCARQIIYIHSTVAVEIANKVCAIGGSAQVTRNAVEDHRAVLLRRPMETIAGGERRRAASRPIAIRSSRDEIRSSIAVEIADKIQRARHRRSRSRGFNESFSRG